MSDGRYEGELFTRFDGDREAGKRYVPEARKVMGGVLADAAHNNLGVHKIRKQLTDGAVIVAEKIGDLKRVTITPPPGPGGRKPVRIFEDMVLTAGARSYDDVTGDRVIQPIIFSPVQGEGGLTWDTYFFNADSPGYSDAAKGTYSDVFHNADTRRDILPEATRNWFNADGEFCAWGSAVSHNASPYRHPRSLYSRTVQRLGRLVFASSIYIDEEGANLPWSLVLSAAFRGDWLYMVMAELGSLDYSTRPAEGAVMGDAWASPHFSDTPFDYALVRVRMVQTVDPVSNQVYFKAKDESHEVLWTGSLVRAYSAWTFNRDCTECVSYQMPEESIVRYIGGEIDTELLGNNVRFSLQLAFDDEEDSASASFSTSAAGAVVFEDNGQLLTVEKVGAHSYRYFGPEYNCVAYLWNGSVETVRELMYADLANNKYVFFETRVTLNAGTNTKTANFSAFVVEDGVETEVESRALGPVGYSDLLLEMEDKVRNDIDAMNVEGLAFAYRGVCGCVIMRETEDSTPEDPLWELAAMSRNGNLIPIVINMDAFGIANGGMATTVVNDPEGPWPWTDTIGVGQGGSYDPEYAEEFTVLYIAGAIQSASSFLMCSYYWPAANRMVNYITDGDLVDLLNFAFPGYFVLGSYVLGRPPISQKYEVSR